MLIPPTMKGNKNLQIALMNIEANLNRAKRGDLAALDRIIEIVQEYKGEPIDAPVSKQEAIALDDVQETESNQAQDVEQ